MSNRITYFRIIELPICQVLLEKDFDSDKKSTPLLNLTFFIDGAKVSQKLYYDNEIKRDVAFNSYSEENAKILVDTALSMFKE